MSSTISAHVYMRGVFIEVKKNMNSCPNCGRTLAYPLSHCRGGHCPFCSYKPADYDERDRAEPREPPDIARIRKQMESLGLPDADIERLIGQAKEAKEKYSRACPRCGNMVDMRKRDDIRFHNDRLCTPRQSQRGDPTRLGKSSNE